MRPVRDFESFIRDGIVTKRSPDVARSKSLVMESECSYRFLIGVVEKMGTEDENANNIIKSAYDIVMELIRARMLLAGFDASGQGAHEAEVSYMRKLDFSEGDVRFADQLRYFRNGMTYYGKMLDREYAEKVLNFLEKVRSRLSIHG